MKQRSQATVNIDGDYLTAEEWCRRRVVKLKLFVIDGACAGGMGNTCHDTGDALTLILLRRFEEEQIEPMRSRLASKEACRIA